MSPLSSVLEVKHVNEEGRGSGYLVKLRASLSLTAKTTLLVTQVSPSSTFLGEHKGHEVDTSKSNIKD